MIKCEDDKINEREINDNSQHIQKIIQDMLLYKKIIYFQGKIISKNHSNSKDQILSSLIQELKYIERQNMIFKAHYDYLHNKTQSSCINKNEIKEYCKLQKGEMKDFVENISRFETSITKLRKEKEITIRTNDAVITQKIIEKQKLEKELNKITLKVDQQFLLLNELTFKTEKLANIFKDNKEMFENEIQYQVNKYKTLLGKYKYLLTQGSYLKEWENKRYFDKIIEMEQKREKERKEQESHMYYLLIILVL